MARTAISLATCLAFAPAWGQSRPAGSAEEIAPFRITGMEGHVQVHALRDEYDIRQTATPAGEQSHRATTLFRTEVFLMTHGYVYLPGLLSLDLGAGPILDRTSFEADGSSRSSTRGMYNLSCKATVLRDKPYGGSVYYEHLNPTQIVGPAQVMFVQSERYGAEASVRDPVTPVPVTVEAARFRNEGRSAESVQDDRTDQLSLRLTRRIGSLGDSLLRLESVRQDSRSGSTALPIQESRTQRDGASFDTRLRYVGRGEHSFDESFRYSSQKVTRIGGESVAENRDTNLSLNLASKYSDAWQSQERYSFSDNRMDGQSTTAHALAGSVAYRPVPEFTATAGLTGDSTRSTQLDATHGTANASATWQRELALGTASINYAYSLSLVDQQAKAAEAAVVGERLVLAGTSLLTLRSRRVVAGSVVVSNAARTQVFAEGIDYTLTQVGLVTRVQRLVSGSITDGEAVLVDYAYDTGGTYALTDSSHLLGLRWSYKNIFSAYVQYQDLTPTVRSGEPTFVLNPVQSTLVGTRVDLPLAFNDTEILLGGFAEREDRREVVSPYRRTAYDAFAQFQAPFIPHTSLRIGGRRNNVDYDYSPLQAVRLTAWDLRLWSQPFYGFDFSVDFSQERDTGTPVARNRRYMTARATWRVRQVRMGFDFSRTLEEQGAYRIKRGYAQLILRRDF